MAKVTHKLGPVTRANQKADVIYVIDASGNVEQGVVFVSPDGEGRFYYDTLDEAQEQHGDLPIVLADAVEDF